MIWRVDNGCELFTVAIRFCGNNGDGPSGLKDEFQSRVDGMTEVPSTDDFSGETDRTGCTIRCFYPVVCEVQLKSSERKRRYSLTVQAPGLPEASYD